MIIYVVQGTTGEYSDKLDWIVCAFKKQKLAEDFVHNAMKRAKEIEKAKESKYSTSKEKNEFDPDMQMDYTGTEYTYYKTELK